MTPAETLLGEMRRRGVTLAARDGRLDYEGDLDDRDLERLARHKTALLRLLASPAANKPKHKSVASEPRQPRPASAGSSAPADVARPRPHVTRIKVVPIPDPRKRRVPARDDRSGRFASRVPAVTPQTAVRTDRTDSTETPAPNLLSRIVYGADPPTSPVAAAELKAGDQGTETTKPARDWLARLLFGE